VYNFYPSAQGDAEINIVERAWNKIQAFHELFGEDSKIFSKEEELVIHDLMQHDEDEGSQSLKYIDILKRFRSKTPLRYAELESLMKKVLSAKGGTDAHKTAAHIKNSRGHWYYAYSEHPYSISQQEMIDILACPETEKATKIDTVELNAALAAILEQYTTDRQNENINIKTKTTLPSQNRQKAMNILNDYARIEGLSPEVSGSLQDILLSVRIGNSVLINEITRTKPNTLAAFAEADIQNWMRYVRTEKHTGESGIVTLAMQCTEGGNNG
jgi:hypothetical protein